jgi:transcriptional regulator with XRE-family HTH domain
MPVYGERMKARRIALNLSLKQITDELGIKAYQQYYDWEQGKHSPPIKYLDKLAVVLKCSVDYLVGLVDDPLAHLEEADLTDDERELIRRRREDPNFREITDVLLRGIPIRRFQELSYPMIEGGENPPASSPDDTAQDK